MVRINFMGDVMFAELLETYRRGLIATLDHKGLDPFQYARPLLERGDLNVINLECVLSDRSTLQKPFADILIAPERFLKFLVDNRINVVTTANNHALDHGIEALGHSIDLLSANGIAVIGYRPGNYFQLEPVVVNVGGRRIGFLGYNISNFPVDDRRRVVDRIKSTIAESRGSVDTLVVSMHWGEEYSNIPPPYVIRFGREILAAGCDILHGHHSHQIQGVLRDQNRIFAPSLGNFVFDQMIRSNRITAVLSVSIAEDSLSYEYLPYFMNRHYQPEPAPQYEGYIEKINSYLAESYAAGNEDRYAGIIQSRVRDGHRRNRIRMRLMMLGHFWDYMPYRREIRDFRRSRKRLFSVITGQESLPKGSSRP
jgi:poly-gamma-glutamate synthesis protein (capsule biosynthesis protein)